MAVFGRRQPHAPIVLRGLLPARPPVAVARVVGQKAAQAAADRYFRRSFPPLIRRGGGPKATAQAVLVQRQSQPAARRPQGRAVVARAGGPAPTARSLTVQRVAQPAARRPQGLAKIVTAGGPAVVARSLVVQRVSQPAARRPQGRATGIRAGGTPAVGRSIVVQRVAQPAGRRPQSRPILLAPPRAAPPPVTAPVGVAVLVQRVPQAAARRPGSRVLTARAGGRPAVGRGFVRLAPSVSRPVRRPVLISPAPPAASAVVLPAASDVRAGVVYDANNLPDPGDVRAGVVYG